MPPYFLLKGVIVTNVNFILTFTAVTVPTVPVFSCTSNSWYYFHFHCVKTLIYLGLILYICIQQTGCYLV